MHDGRIRPFEPRVDEVERLLYRQWSREHTRIRREPHDCEKNRPSERAGLRAGELPLEPGFRLRVVRRSFVDRVQQQVRVDELHLRSSSLRIVSASSSSPAKRRACSRSMPGRKASGRDASR
jgi:hypothetical protein